MLKARSRGEIKENLDFSLSNFYSTKEYTHDK
jgi:hypothetical protein